MTMEARRYYSAAGYSLALSAAGVIFRRRSDAVCVLIRDMAFLTVLVELQTPKCFEDIAEALDGIPRTVLRQILGQLIEVGLCGLGEPIDKLDNVSTRANSSRLSALAYEISCRAVNIPLFGSEQMRAALDSAQNALGYAVESAEVARLACVRAANLYREGLSDIIRSQEKKPYRVLLGGGPQGLSGWVNFDLCAIKYPVDLRLGIPVDTGSAVSVYCGFLLEHLFFPGEALSLAREMVRILRPGCVARIVLPDAAMIIAEYTAGNEKLLRDRWNSEVFPHSPLSAAMCYLGAQPDSAALPSMHKFAFDFNSLRVLLLHAGFKMVYKSGYMGSKYGELNIDDVSTALHGSMENGRLALFVEAHR